MSIFKGLSLVSVDDHYTFEYLADAPGYSLEGGLYLGAAATATIEGTPADVMRANGLIYNFNTDLVVSILSITQRVQISAAGNYFLSPGLIIPGSVREDGQRVTDYAAWYLFDSAKFKYSQVAYE